MIKGLKYFCGWTSPAPLHLLNPAVILALTHAQVIDTNYTLASPDNSSTVYIGFFPSYSNHLRSQNSEQLLLAWQMSKRQWMCWHWIQYQQRRNLPTKSAHQKPRVRYLTFLADVLHQATLFYIMWSFSTRMLGLLISITCRRSAGGFVQVRSNICVHKIEERSLHHYNTILPWTK